VLVIKLWANREWALVALMGGSLVLAGAACDDDDNNNTNVRDTGVLTGDGGGFIQDGGTTTLDAAVGGTEAGGGDGAGADLAVESRLSEPQVLAVVIEANNGEVAAGEVADARAQDMRAAAFGRRMINEHSAANQRARVLADTLALMPSDSGVRRMLSANAHALVEMLWAQPAATFDRAYVQSQIMVHMQVLTLIDTVLLPSTTTAQLRAELMTMRTAVMSHLTDAQALLPLLQGDGGVAGDGGGAGDGGTDGATADAGADGGGDAAANDAAGDASLTD
jgi:putative membrane protein